MESKTYKQGMTSVFCDGEKVVVFNPTGDRHVKTNVDVLFGAGEFQKMWDTKYFSYLNKSGRKFELITGYIPDKIKKDMGFTKDNEPMKKNYSEHFK